MRLIYYTMKKGFTLVELSIVLVIIGLLVGGILVGQSLVDSAKLNRFVGELSQYKIMVDQFESRYRSLPGDTSLFPIDDRGTATANDRLFFDITSTTQTFSGEISHFWKHLSDAGIATKKYEVDAASGIVAGTNTPEIVYDNASLVPLTLVPGTGMQTFIMSDYSTHTDNAVGSNVPAISAIEALAIDSKIDDGLSITDSYTGDSSGFDYKDQMFADSGNDCWESLTPASGPKNYNTSDDTAKCVVFLRFK